eukprot:9355747-Alexandrium_andersonii.AAC.1
MRQSGGPGGGSPPGEVRLGKNYTVAISLGRTSRAPHARARALRSACPGSCAGVLQAEPVGDQCATAG